MVLGTSVGGHSIATLTHIDPQYLPSSLLRSVLASHFETSYRIQRLAIEVPLDCFFLYLFISSFNKQALNVYYLQGTEIEMTIFV